MSFKFERMEVWRPGIEFANEIFDLVESLPREYHYSLGEQLRRAGLSIPTNIAEGCGRDSRKEQIYFYRVAKGSVYEVVSLLVMIGKRGCLSGERYRTYYDEADQIAAMLSALTR